jgi:hypothetical protein
LFQTQELSFGETALERNLNPQPGQWARLNHLAFLRLILKGVLAKAQNARDIGVKILEGDAVAFVVSLLDLRDEFD